MSSSDRSNDTDGGTDSEDGEEESVAGRVTADARSERSTEHSRPARWAPAALVVLVVAAFARTLRYGLYLDDYALLRPWTAAQLANGFRDQFDPSGFNPPYFRPLAPVSFALDWSVWGDWVVGNHLTNLLLHGAVVLLLYVLLLRLAIPWWAALLGASYFAIVPSNVATVVYIAERTDAMVAVALIVGLLFVERYDRDRRLRWIVGLNACLLIALLCKEIAAALVPMALLLWWHLRSTPVVPGQQAPNGWRGAGSDWRRVAVDLGRALVDRRGRRDWLVLSAPSTVLLVVYLAYRDAVLPSESGLSSRFGETQNPISGLLAGLNSVAKGVPWEVGTRAFYPLAVIVFVSFLWRPRDRHWRLALLGGALAASGVLPLTISGGVEPRLLYVAQIGMAVLVAAVVIVSVNAVGATADRRRARVVAIAGAGLAVVVAAALVGTMVQAQDLFAEGSDKKLSADLEVHRQLTTEWVLPRHLEAIERRLRSVGMID